MADITTDLEIHYKLDDPSGTTADDSSGNARDGTLVGGGDFTDDSITGKIALALNFPGDSNTEYFNGPTFDTGTSFTLAAWVNPDSLTATMSIAANRNDWTTSTPWVWRVSSSGTLIIARDGYSKVSATGVVSTGVWTHVAVTHNGTHIQHYVNGATSGASQTYVTASQTSGVPIRVGSNYQSASYADVRWVGGIDDFRVYSRVLTVGDLQALSKTINPSRGKLNGGLLLGGKL